MPKSHEGGNAGEIKFVNTREREYENVNFRQLAGRILHEFNADLKASKEWRKNTNEAYRAQGQESHHISVYDVRRVVTDFLALKELHALGAVSDEEFDLISKDIKDLTKYENERIEARAEAYSVGRGDEKEKYRQYVLQNDETLLLQELADHFKNQE